jgi:Zn-dependent protease with chaperone function
MRTGLAYTSARILLFAIALVLLRLLGVGGLLLFALALVISALASYVLLSRQREVLAGALNRRLGRVTAKATEFRERIEDGAAAEDDQPGSPG